MRDKGHESSSQREHIAEALSRVASAGSKFMNGDSSARETLIARARELVAATETPVETLLWTIWAMVRARPLLACCHAKQDIHICSQRILSQHALR